MSRGRDKGADAGHELGRVELIPLRVGEQRWALPLAAVERVLAIVAMTPLPNSPAGVLGAVNVHGEIVPVLDLDLRIGQPPRERGSGGMLVLARTGHRRVALPVDDVGSVLTVDRDAIGPPPEGMPGPLGGMAALPDGVLLVSDVDALLSAGEEELLATALAGAVS